MPTPARPASRPRLLAVLGVLAALLLSGCSELEGTGDKGYITGDGRVQEVAPDDRGEPVDLTGESLTGEPLDLADLRGGVAVVNVWYSTCPPCRAEQPELTSAANASEGTAEFVGLNIREYDTSMGLAFNRTFDVPYPSFFSPDGQDLLAFSGTLSPQSIPSTVVLDAEGRVAASIIGPLPSEQTLLTLIDDVAAETGGGQDGTQDGTQDGDVRRG
jgi:thiol-disulfide isomerase/thioredoxin